MEASTQPQNPYLANPSAEWMAHRDASMSQQPRWLKPIAIISMVIGTLGFGNGCLSVIGVLFQGFIQRLVNFQPGGVGNGGQAQMDALTRRMQQDLMAIQQENWISLLLFSMMAIVSGALLFWGGLAILRDRPNGVSVLRKGFIFAIVYLAGHTLFSTYMWFETKPITDRYFEDLITTMPQKQKQGTAGLEIMRGTMKGVMIVTLVIQVFFVVTKIVLYLLGTLYLGRVIKKLAEHSVVAEIAPTG